MATAVETWAPAFTTYFGTDIEKFNRSWFNRIDRIVGNFADGPYCKLCEMKLDGDIEKHHKKHLRELDKWLKIRDTERAEVKAEQAKIRAEERALEARLTRQITSSKKPRSEFYDHKCPCGSSIARQKGRAPQRCSVCRKK